MMSLHPPLWLILVAFVCVLGPLVFFHELGHYLVARLFKVPAEVFSIGFGHELAGWTDGQGTRWKVGWLPLGGYVRFIGDMNATSTPMAEADIPEHLRDRAFQFRPLWQRFLIVLAGPAANFLLAIVIFAAFYMTVGGPGTNVVGTILPKSAAAAAGLQPGDRILSVGGRNTSDFDDIRAVVTPKPNQMTPLRFERGGLVRNITVRLNSETAADYTGRHFKIGELGVTPQPLPIYRAVPEASRTTWAMTRSIVDGLIGIVAGRISASEIGGPIRIAQIAGQGASLGVLALVQLAALLSINLGFINLVPVPLLDGGHLFFYTIEAVRRRPLSERALEWSFRGGLAAILALLVFTTINDLGSLGLWDRLQRLIG